MMKERCLWWAVLLVGHCGAHGIKVGLAIDPHPYPFTTRMNAAGAMACHHINGRVSSLVSEISGLPAFLNVTCDFVSLTNHEQGVVQTVQWTESEQTGHCLHNETTLVDAIVGPFESQQAGPMSVVAAVTNTPVVSHAAVAYWLSDKSLYPNFARTALAEDVTASALLRVIRNLGWQRFGIIHSSGLWQTSMAQSFAREAGRLGLTMATSQSFQSGGEELTSTMAVAMAGLAESGAHILIELVDWATQFDDLVHAAYQHGLVGRSYQWISPFLPSQDFTISDRRADPDAVYEFLRGNLQVAAAPFNGGDGAARFNAVWQSHDPDALLQLLPPAAQALFPDASKLTSTPCSSSCALMFRLPPSPAIYHLPDIETHTPESVSLLTYDAVISVALAAGKAAQEHGDAISPAQILSKIGTLSFQGTSGPVAFDQNLDRSTDGLSFLLFVKQGVDPLTRLMTSVPIGEYQIGGDIARIEDTDFEWASRERGWAALMEDATTCGSGTEFSESSLHCEPCLPGTFANASRQGCQECPVGFYSPRERMTYCLRCGQDGYADSEGSSTCKPCPQNHEIRQADAESVSKDICQCRPGFVVGCRYEMWKPIVLACGVLVLFTLAWSLFVLGRTRSGADDDQRLVDARVKVLRKMLWIQRKDGFRLDGEWSRWREMTHVKTRLLDSFARLTLLLDFDVRQVDMLTSVIRFWGDGSFASSIDELTDAGSDEEGKQYLMLRHILLETSKFILDPSLPDGAVPADKTFTWARKPTASERFDFFRNKIAKLKIWADGLNFLYLKTVAQLHMDGLRQSCDDLYAKMITEEGGDELVALELTPPSLRYANVCRQDHALVKAIPRVDTMNAEVQARKLSSPVASPSSSARRKGSDALALALAESELGPVNGEVRVRCEDDKHGEDSRFVRRAMSDGAALQEGRVASGNSSGLPQTVVRSSSMDNNRRNAPSLGLWLRRASAGTKTREEEWSLTALSGVGARRGESARRLERLRALHAELRDNARGINDKGAVLDRVFADEKPYVHFLRNRAELLNSAFHDKIQGLCSEAFGVSDVPVPEVHPGPVKTKKRMMEKVAEYEEALQHRGSADALPLSALILDPLRVSLVCSHPLQVVQCAQWLMDNGEKFDLPVVRLKNKFAALNSSEYDGYRDIMMCVLFQGDMGLNIIGEIQIQDQRMHALKVKMHRLYKVKRASAASKV